MEFFLHLTRVVTIDLQHPFPSFFLKSVTFLQKKKYFEQKLNFFTKSAHVTAKAMTELFAGQSSASLSEPWGVTNTSSPVFDQSIGATWKSVAEKNEYSQTWVNERYPITNSDHLPSVSTQFKCPNFCFFHHKITSEQQRLKFGVPRVVVAQRFVSAHVYDCLRLVTCMLWGVVNNKVSFFWD